MRKVAWALIAIGAGMGIWGNYYHNDLIGNILGPIPFGGGFLIHLKLNGERISEMRNWHKPKTTRED